jgi:hypothetical protein
MSILSIKSIAQQRSYRCTECLSKPERTCQSASEPVAASHFPEAEFGKRQKLLSMNRYDDPGKG